MVSENKATTQKPMDELIQQLLVASESALISNLSFNCAQGQCQFMLPQVADTLVTQLMEYMETFFPIKTLAHFPLLSSPHTVVIMSW